jgi:hypothetical protein
MASRRHFTMLVNTNLRVTAKHAVGARMRFDHGTPTDHIAALRTYAVAAPCSRPRLAQAIERLACAADRSGAGAAQDLTLAIA